MTWFRRRKELPAPESDDQTAHSPVPWSRLVLLATSGMQGQGAIVEASRRVVKALEVSERSATALGKRIWWLTLWLLIFTAVICGLTIVLVLADFGALRRAPHEGASVLWWNSAGMWEPIRAWPTRQKCEEDKPHGTTALQWRCLPDTVDPRGPKGGGR